jgi:nitrogen fixation protein NifM
MTAPGTTADPADPVFAYHLLRVASESFGAPPYALNESQLLEAEGRAADSVDLQRLVLESDEGRGVSLPGDVIDQALSEIVGRYEDRASFEADMARCGLDEAGLRAALGFDLIFDAVLEGVGGGAPKVGDDEVVAYYKDNPDRFSAPETREVSQILITVNDEFPENERAEARRRLQEIVERIAADPASFGREAQANSECPSALKEGDLGRVKRGTLFPELDAALFALEEGGLSDVVETELGFHLLRCDKVHPASVVALENVAERIRDVLSARRRREHQKEWLRRLRKSAAEV